MPAALPVSRLIKVAVDLTPAGAQAQDLNTLLLLGSSAIIDTVERFRNYESIDAVAADFGINAPEYIAANLYFQQTPQPTRLKIGRWLATAASGTLRGAPLSAAAQTLTNFTSITAGGFTYSRNGAAATNVTGLNLSSATNLNAVAALITASLTGATMVWNANFSRFELTSSATGTTSSISFLSAPGSGTDISGLLGMTGASSGAYRADGAAAESALAAVTFFDSNFGQQWYGVVVLGAANSDHLAIAPYIEAANNKHVYGITTQEGGALVAATTTDIAYQLSQLRYSKSFVQYSSSSPYAVVSLMAKTLTVDYAANNSVITLMYKQQPGIVAENLNSTQADSLKAKKCNAFVNFENDTAIILNGVASSGEYIDEITGTDALAVDLQTALYNLLYTSPTKIPQTDAGTHLLVTTAESVMLKFVNNGFLAPGVWKSQGFGILKTDDYLPKGFYIYAPPVATQSTADRSARKSVPIQVAAKLAGAVHEVNFSVLVNR